MSSPDTKRGRYLAVLIFGTVVGGIVVAVATKAIPRIMSQMMAQMMAEMPRRMRAEGFDPEEMCQRMMANFSPSQSSEASTNQGHN